MTRDELQTQLSEILPNVREALDLLTQLQWAPAWDESYKVERDERINAERLTEIRVAAENLADVCDLSRSLPPVLELSPEGGVDGLVLSGLALASSMFGSTVARNALAGAAFELTRQHVEKHGDGSGPHVFITLECNNCHNSSKHPIVGVGTHGKHVAEYYAHHQTCERTRSG